MKNKPNFFLMTGVSQTGGWGDPPLGNFSHIIPFFSLMATLRGLYIYQDVEQCPTGGGVEGRGDRGLVTMMIRLIRRRRVILVSSQCPSWPAC